MIAKRVLPVAVTAAGLVLGACYEYLPVQPSVPEAGAIVQADLHTEAASRLTPTFGPGILSVHGMVLRQEPDAIAVLVDTYATARNGELAGNNEPVLLQYPEISALAIKTLSKKKSVILGAALAAGGALTAVVFTDLGRQFTNAGEDTIPSQDLRSGFRFRIPIGLRIPLPGR